MSQELQSMSSEQRRLVQVILSTSGVDAAAEYVKMPVATFRARFAAEVEEREWLNEQLKRYDIPSLAAERLKADDDDYWSPPDAPPEEEPQGSTEQEWPRAPLSAGEEAQAVGLLIAGWPLEEIAEACEIPMSRLKAEEPALRKRARQMDKKMDLDLVQEAFKGDKAARRLLRARKSVKAPIAPPLPGPSADPSHFITMRGHKGELVTYSKANRDPSKGPVFDRQGVVRVSMLLGDDVQRRRMAEAAVRTEIEQNLLAQRRDGKL